MKLAAVGLALLFVACGHPTGAPRDPIDNEVAAPRPIDAGIADAEDECYLARHCAIKECEERQLEREHDGGVSCDDQCVLDGVADGRTEEDAALDCFWQCQCGE